MTEKDPSLRQVVAEVAAAYLLNAHLPAADLPDVIAQIAESLRRIEEPSADADSGRPAALTETPSTRATPAPAAAAGMSAARMAPAQVRRSIKSEALVSFEDGRPYRALKLHLAGRGLTPDQYREKWGLPYDYPMVAPSYSAARSEIAKKNGFGSLQKGRKAAAVTQRRRGRPPKTGSAA